jgi:hypothetical protein
MDIRSLRWNLVVWNPSLGPADPYGAPRFTHLTWAVRARWRPITLVAGVLLAVLGVTLPSSGAFLAGLLVLLFGLLRGPSRSHCRAADQMATAYWHG